MTGERSDVVGGLAESVAAIKKTTPLPIAVGFGIGTPEQVRAVASAADAVVVGSAIVKRIAEFGSDPKFVEKVCAFVKPLADAARTKQ